MKYIPQSESDRQSMLKQIGLDSIDDLFQDIPAAYKAPRNLDYPRAMSEMELRRHFDSLSQKGKSPQKSHVGCGIYQHDVPSIVPFLVQRSEFATSYTPYQPEVSQGTLQCIFEYQSLACQLTESELSNASLYDGATSLGEAALMALRIKKKSSRKILVSSLLHPFYRQVLDTYCEAFLDRFVDIPAKGDQLDLKFIEENLKDADLLITQSPNIFGVVENYVEVSKLKKQNEALWITSTMEAMSFGVLRGPGAFGADIVTAEGQSFGNHPYLGGSTFGIFCTKNEFLRNLPGRLVGQSVDEEGRPAYTLTFATREQFIRRGRATSNICTNNNLNMIAGLIHMVTLGREGFREIAHQNLSKTEYLKKALREIPSLKISESPTFNEFVVETNQSAAELIKKAMGEDTILGVDLGRFNDKWKHKLLMHVSEIHSKESLDQTAQLLQKVLSQ